jgi:hypothetical protein
MSTAQVTHAAEQDELTGKVPYEVKLRNRIVRLVTANPKATQSWIQSRLGFVVGNCFETVFTQMIEDGTILGVSRSELLGYVVGQETAAE